jgi:hypothetical protein
MQGAVAEPRRVCDHDGTTLLAQIDGAGAQDYLGRSVASAGDIDGDGRDEFIISEYSASPGDHTLAGSVYIYKYSQ